MTVTMQPEEDLLAMEVDPPKGQNVSYADPKVSRSTAALSGLNLASQGQMDFGAASSAGAEGLNEQERAVQRIANARKLEQIKKRRHGHARDTRRTGPAQMDSRNQNYHQGGGYNRKRRFREDDDFDRRNQRRRYEEPLSSRVRKEILEVAESAFRRPEDEVKDIARKITDNYDDDYFIRSITQLLPQLVLEQPLKIPCVAAILLYANEQKTEFTQSIIATIANRLQEHLDKGNWREVKLLLRLLALTQALFDGEGVFEILEELFNRAVDLQTASSEDTVGLELVKIILLTIPYALTTPNPELEQKATDLLEKTDIITSTPHLLVPLVDPIVSVDDSDVAPCSSLISLLQKQLQTEGSKNWELAFMSRLYTPPRQQDGEEEVKSSQKLEFPSIAVPQPVNPGPKMLFPEVFFSMFADQEIETVPPTTHLASSILRDCFVDTINLLDFNRAAAAKSLIDLDCYWAFDTFVKRATPFDKLKDIDGKSTWKPEDLAVDAIFSQMLQLPTPEHKIVFYHSLITETCKIAPAAIAPSLGRAIRFLYRRLSSLDQELFYRFLDWFAHHLSNFDFRWKWVEWIPDIDLSRLQSKKAFILGVLDKEVRLSFASRIRQNTPENYHALIPSTKDNEIPYFKYSSDQTPFAEQARELLSLLKKKAPEEEIQPVFDAIHTQAAQLNYEHPFLPSTEAYVTSICYIGSKSLSHILSFIERCRQRLLAIGAEHPLARKQIVNSVVGFWREQNPGVAVNIVDKLLNYTILTPMSVIEWALIDNIDGGRSLSETWMYEMVSSTVFKVTNRIRQIVTARNQKGNSKEQLDLLEETLVTEREAMRALFAVINDALVGIAESSQDKMLEGSDETLEAERLDVEAWGSRWLRVFRRKLAVEEAVVGEMLKMVPEPAMEIDSANGTANGNGVDAADTAEDLIDI